MVCDLAASGNMAEGEQSTIKLFKEASPSVVHVFARSSRSVSPFSEEQESVVQSGSGIIWDAAGHVITNNHVINGTSQIGVGLTSGEFVGARIVGAAPNYDLAILQLERPRSPCTPSRSAVLRICKSARLRLRSATLTAWNRP